MGIIGGGWVLKLIGNIHGLPGWHPLFLYTYDANTILDQTTARVATKMMINGHCLHTLLLSNHYFSLKRKTTSLLF